MRCNRGVACDGDVGEIGGGIATTGNGAATGPLFVRDVAVAKGGSEAREGGSRLIAAVLVNARQGDVVRGGGLVVDVGNGDAEGFAGGGPGAG